MIAVINRSQCKIMPLLFTTYSMDSCNAFLLIMLSKYKVILYEYIYLNPISFYSCIVCPV